MNLDYYINGYIDGELTPQEDDMLRALLSENPLLRDEFDNAVFMHVAMRRDAENIDVPSEFVDLLENNLLLELSKNKQATGNTQVNQNAFSNTQSHRTSFSVLHIKRRRNLVALLLLIATIAQAPQIFHQSLFSNHRISLPPVQFYQVLPQEHDVTGGRLQARNSVNYDNLKHNQTHPNNEQLNTKPLNLSHNSFADNRQLFESTTLNAAEWNTFDKIDTTTNSEIMKSTVVNDMDAAMQELPNISSLQKSTLHDENTIITPVSLNSSSLQITQGHTTILIPEEKQEIVSNLSTVASLSFLRDRDRLPSYVTTTIAYSANSNNKTHINPNQVSYSLTVPVSENNAVGFELGSLIIYNNSTFGSIDNQSQKRGGVQSVHNASVLGENDDELSGSSEMSFVSRFNTQLAGRALYWGAAYFQNNIRFDEDICISSRLGVGASGDGPVVYSRSALHAEIYGSISIFGGIDARMFVLQKQLSEFSVQTSTISTISFIYGIQLAF